VQKAKRPRSSPSAAATRTSAPPAPAAAAAPAVAHSFDLELDDPPFLIASALLTLGTLHEARGDLPAALSALSAALAVFPSFIAAHVAAARITLALAGSAAEVDDAERQLVTALAAAEQLEAAEEGLVAASNRACKREVEAGGEARTALAMLLCQAGRGPEAAVQLEALGFSWRLAGDILCYPLPSKVATATVGAAVASAASGTARAGEQLPLAVLDNALPLPLLQRLQAAFAPASPFWSSHGYGPRQGYFSYMFELVSSWLLAVWAM